MRAAPRGERVFGAVLIGVGLFALIAGRHLAFGTLREPGTGFFPLTIAAALIVFAALAIFGGGSGAEQERPEGGGIHRVWILAALLAGYAWLLPSAGFVLCTAVLLGAVMRGLGGVAWLPMIIGAGAGAAGCYFLFTRLGMPLPRGLLGF